MIQEDNSFQNGGENYSLPSVQGDGTNALTTLDATVNHVVEALDVVSDVTASFDEMVHTLADMHVAVKQIDAELDAFKAATGAKLEKFKSQVPVLDRQMDNISARIDKVTDKILSLTDDDMSEQTLQKQAMLMDLLSKCNDSFNNMVMKLMEF